MIRSPYTQLVFLSRLRDQLKFLKTKILGEDLIPFLLIRNKNSLFFLHRHKDPSLADTVHVQPYLFLYENFEIITGNNLEMALLVK